MRIASPTRSGLAVLLLAAGLSLPLAAAAATAPGSGAAGSASGGAGTGASGGAGGKGAGSAGEKVFQSAMPPCATCHQLKAGVNQPGPSLAGIATRAAQRVAAKDYKGKAKDARAYLRESIMAPDAYIVPGQTYAANGQSLMPKTYAQALKPEQIDQLVDYMMTLK